LNQTVLDLNGMDEKQQPKRAERSQMERLRKENETLKVIYLINFNI
jgi:hypothetical protein